MTKELRKMPKVFFADSGLRNHFINNFEPVLLREDRGALFENFVFRLFYDKIQEDNIKYWRTQKQQEIDFIINSKKAFEVKFSASSFKPSKYAAFKKSYPDIPLQLIHYENVLQTNYDI
jgi:predicted AAA+ superfamily ATPase